VAPFRTELSDKTLGGEYAHRAWQHSMRGKMLHLGDKPFAQQVSLRRRLGAMPALAALALYGAIGALTFNVPNQASEIYVALAVYCLACVTTAVYAYKKDSTDLHQPKVEFDRNLWCLSCHPLLAPSAHTPRKFLSPERRPLALRGCPAARSQRTCW
jgi:hypothetical protein